MEGGGEGRSAGKGRKGGVIESKGGGSKRGRKGREREQRKGTKEGGRVGRTESEGGDNEVVERQMTDAVRLPSSSSASRHCSRL